MSTIRRKFEQARDRAAALAAQAERTDAEEQELTDQLDRAEALKADLDATEARDARIEALGTVSRAIAIPGTLGHVAEPPAMTAGEFLAEFFQAHHPEGNSTPEQFRDRAARYLDRAQQATTDTPGIIPSPIIGDVVKFADSSRPVFNSMTSRGMPPKGKTFERPRVTQRVQIGTQDPEGEALASRKMTLTSDTVTKATQGGFLDITQQDIDWSEPEALQLVVTDFAEVYAEWTEGLACAFLTATATAEGDYAPTDVGTIVASYVQGILDVYATAKRFPDTAWLDLASWAELVTTQNENNDTTALAMLREAFSELGVGSFRFIVGPQLAAETRIIGASSLIESYEQQKGLLRAELPSVLSVQLAYAGYTAFWGRPEGFVSLVDAS